MASWNPKQYLQFADLRSRPCHDLANRVGIPHAGRIVDLGCGTGNSTEVLAARWPDASITGIDSSPAMIDAARSASPNGDWRAGNIEDWLASPDERYDLVFSTAALQWVGNHARLFPALFAHVEPGGALAVQMPCNYHTHQNRIPRELAASPKWRRWFPEGRAQEWFSYEPDFYYDLLAPLASRLDIWTSEYLQPMADAEAIVDWYKGTGLRPYLEAIGDDAERRRFLSEYLARLRPHYPARASGGVLFAFRRVFIVAYH